jgi:signal transduction histidine kinase
LDQPWASSRDSEGVSDPADSMEVGHALLDREGRILRLNPAARRLCSLPPTADVLTLRARGTLGPGPDWGWIPGQVADLGVGTAFVSPVPADEGTRYLHFTLVPHGEQVSVTFSDTTEEVAFLRSLSAKLSAAGRSQERLEQFLSLQEDLLFSLSHDLKTPPVVIQGFSELLLRGRYGALGEEQEKPLQTIYRNVLMLSTMVDQLLDFSRLLRRIHSTPSPMSLARSWTEAAAGFGNAGYLLATFPACRVEGDDTVIAERNALTYALRNLVTNSLRLARPGTQIRPSVTRRGNAVELVLELEVLMEEHPSLPRLLDGMFQATSAAQTEAGLSGPGLAAARYLATVMGGRLVAEETATDTGRIILTLPAGR